GGVLEQALELGHVRLLVAGDDVDRLEAVLDVHPEPRPALVLDLRRDVGRALREVAEVTDGGLHDVLVAEEAADLGRLRRRLHDHQLLAARGGALARHCCPLLSVAPYGPGSGPFPPGPGALTVVPPRQRPPRPVVPRATPGGRTDRHVLPTRQSAPDTPPRPTRAPTAGRTRGPGRRRRPAAVRAPRRSGPPSGRRRRDRKSTRLNSS